MYICDGKKNVYDIYPLNCAFSIPEDFEGGTNTLNEVTEDFLSHINWQELRKVTEGFFFYTLPGWT